MAGMWDFRRKGWTFRSGGDGAGAPSASGLFKTTDGGATWTELDEKSAKGLPSKPWGRVAVSIAPGKASVVYAFIEAEVPKNGLYRSDDGGATWQAADRSQLMVWRPFYFANLIVDPKDENKVYKPDLSLIASTDGGKSFSDIGGGAHGDFHDVWIDPSNTDHLITGDDGGVWYSYDGGNKWWKADNLPISQFYHVSVDMDRPYHVYGGLQDNSSWVGDSQYPGGITNAQWENMYGGDGFWMFADTADPTYIYAEAQGGEIGRVNRKTHETRNIQPLRRLQGRQAALQLEHADPHEPHAEGHRVHRRPVPLPHARPRPDVAAHLAGPDHQRPRETEAGTVRRRDGGQLRRRDAHHHLRDRRIAEGPERRLGRHR